MTWQPRVELVVAETPVDFPRIDAHIIEQRIALEAAIGPSVTKMADSIFLSGIPAMTAFDVLRDTLYRGLSQTYLFGYREARREILELRRINAKATLAETPPLTPIEVGPFLFLHVVSALHQMLDALGPWYRSLDPGDVLIQAKVRDRAARLAHNLVLELVGQVLNAGRTFAALGRDEPILAEMPAARWAMRSEQLDQNTCIPCHGLHGQTAIVGTPEYFELLPPSGCLGRGRCRGIMVFADDPSAFVLPPGER